MRKALVVGINAYPNAPLRGCVNDATAFNTIIKSNGDGSPNFGTRLYTDVMKKAELTGLISELFRGKSETALFYFSGHGFEDSRGSYLVTPDAQPNDPGVSMSDVLTLANHSEARNKVIILDCCHSGAMGTIKLTGKELAQLNKGVTLLTSSEADEVSIEMGGHGVFTNLLLASLEGGAADVRGKISPGSVYAYIDQALGEWDQRPVFKTNVSTFITLREMPPKVPLEQLRKIGTLFPSAEHLFPLDPSYEFTNTPDYTPLLSEPYADEENVKTFQLLQAYQGAGLVVPVDASYMYFAAMHSKSCKLTALGYHFWKLSKDGRL